MAQEVRRYGRLLDHRASRGQIAAQNRNAALRSERRLRAAERTGVRIAVVGTGVHLIAGHYNSLLLAKLVAGGVVGGLVGRGAAPKIPNRSLRFALSLWLLFIGLQFCYQAVTK